MSSVPASVSVRCVSGGCPARGTFRRVRLRMVALGFMEVPALACAVCGHTAETIIHGIEEERNMPKISTAGGPTDKTLPGYYELGRSEQSPLVVQDAEGQRGDDETEGGERSSAGSSSSASAGNGNGQPRRSRAGRQQRARTTESHSGPARTGASTAPSTGGGQTVDTPASADPRPGVE